MTMRRVYGLQTTGGGSVWKLVVAVADQPSEGGREAGLAHASASMQMLDDLHVDSVVSGCSFLTDSQTSGRMVPSLANYKSST